jgi:pectate lyase
MMTLIAVLFAGLLLMVSGSRDVAAQTGPCPGGAQLAFPTAEGFGRCATRGRGGQVVEVTNLNNGGPGSFLEAMQLSYPRIIVFRVGGVIYSPNQYEVSGANVTIAFQTAPGDGITFRGKGWAFNGGNMIIRHMRIRLDNTGLTQDNTEGLQLKNTGPYIVDHLSMSWGSDDGVLVWNGSNVTVQWSLLGQGLEAAGLLNSKTPNTTFHHNLMMLFGRAPQVAQGPSDVVNNVSYGTFGQARIFPDYTPCMTTNWVGNYFKLQPVPISTSDSGWVAHGAGWPCSGGTQVYASDNLGAVLRENSTIPESAIFSGLASNQFVSTRFPYPQVTTSSAAQAYIDVPLKAGATVPKRDFVDSTYASWVQGGTAFQGTDGSWITSISQFPGGYPTYNGGTPPDDTDHDGMPDTWETTHGLNPNDPSDGPRFAANGYTNVENYLNQLAGDPIPGTLDSTPPAAPTNLRVVWSIFSMLGLLLPIGWKSFSRRHQQQGLLITLDKD